MPDIKRLKNWSDASLGGSFGRGRYYCTIWLKITLYLSSHCRTLLKEYRNRTKLHARDATQAAHKFGVGGVVFVVCNFGVMSV